MKSSGYPADWDFRHGIKEDSFSATVMKDGNYYALYQNGKPLIEYIDEENRIPMGGPALIMSMAFHGGLSQVSFEMGGITPLIDAVRSPSWQNQSNRFIVDVCDKPREDFSKTDQVGELAERIKADEAHYIGWGTPTSEASISSFIRHNNSKGIYVPTSGQLSNAYTQTAKYISRISHDSISGTDRAYLIRDKSYRNVMEEWWDETVPTSLSTESETPVANKAEEQPAGYAGTSEAASDLPNP